MNDNCCRSSIATVLAFAVLIVCMLLSGCEPATEAGVSGSDSALTRRLGGDDVSGYARAMEPRALVFPADHGPHPDYRNEWWYLTGNLETAAGRRFGYQVTFFRIALAPPDPSVEARRSAWATRQVWMAHVALSDLDNRHHQADERFARGAVGLAGAEAEPFRVWLEDWQLLADPSGTGQTWQLQIETTDFSLDLALEPLKPIVLQGDAGLSQKGSEPGNASYYYSLPRLETLGNIQAGGEQFQVAGMSWLDREWSTSALGDDQVGWDWFALQLDDGRDLMFYQLRRTDGQLDPRSAGSLIGPDGTARRLRSTDVMLEPRRWWRSPDGARYPVSWHLEMPDGLRYRIEAAFDDQRMETTISYWEGMVDVLDAETGAARGRGYLELAGYE